MNEESESADSAAIVGISVEEASDLLRRSVVGQRPWRVALGYGTFATFDFGDEVRGRGTSGRMTGSIHLWVQMSSWRVRCGGTLLAGSSDDAGVMAAVLESRQDVEVTDAQIDGLTLDVSLTFADSVSFDTFRSAHKADSWSLHTRGRGVLFTDGGSSLWFEPAS